MATDPSTLSANIVGAVVPLAALGMAYKITSDMIGNSHRKPNKTRSKKIKSGNIWNY